MPQIISTPEDWFRTQRRDLHVICYRKTKGKLTERSKKAYYKQARNDLNLWIAHQMPGTSISIIASSEYDGWIFGGPSYLAVDFDQVGVTLFKAAWDADSPWYVETWTIANWRKRIDATQLLPSPVGELQNLLWWDTPRGFLLLGSDAEGRTLSAADGWWKLQQIFPEFVGSLYDRNFPCGEFLHDETVERKAAVINVTFGYNGVWGSTEYAGNPDNRKRLKEAIGIPEDVAIEMGVFGP